MSCTFLARLIPCCVFCWVFWAIQKASKAVPRHTSVNDMSVFFLPQPYQQSPGRLSPQCGLELWTPRTWSLLCSSFAPPLWISLFRWWIRMINSSLFFRQQCFATKNTYILYFFFWKKKVMDRLKSSRIVLVQTFAMLWSPATAGPRLVGELGCLVHSSSSANAQSEAASAFGWFDDMYFVKRGQRGASFPLGAIGSERGFLSQIL